MFQTGNFPASDPLFQTPVRAPEFFHLSGRRGNLNVNSVPNATFTLIHDLEKVALLPPKRVTETQVPFK